MHNEYIHLTLANTAFAGIVLLLLERLHFLWVVRILNESTYIFQAFLLFSYNEMVVKVITCNFYHFFETDVCMVSFLARYFVCRGQFHDML